MTAMTRRTPETLEAICELAYSEGGRATSGMPWADLPDRGKEQVRSMVRDVLAAYDEVMSTPPGQSS